MNVKMFLKIPQGKSRRTSVFSMSTISSFKSIVNKHDVYRGKDCMKRFCESLRDDAMKIIVFTKKKN